MLALRPEQLQRLALDAGHLVQAHRAGHHLLQLGGRDRFDEVAERAVLHRANRAFDRGAPGHQDERDVQVVLAYRPQELEAVHLGHRDVADDHVEVALARRRRSGLAVEGDLDREARGAQRPCVGAGDRLFVVDQEDESTSCRVGFRSLF